MTQKEGFSIEIRLMQYEKWWQSLCKAVASVSGVGPKSSTGQQGLHLGRKLDMKWERTGTNWKVPLTLMASGLDPKGDAQEKRVTFSQMGHKKCPLSQKEMATHSSILDWKIPWTEEPGGLLSIGLHRVGHD